MMEAASRHFDWGLDHARIAEIWRAGCIIRSSLLDDIAAAFREGAPESHLMLAPALRNMLIPAMPALRTVVAAAVTAGLPVPAMAAAVGYYDSLRQPRGTADLIQGQRDFFGAHGFERVDSDATGLHGPWAGHGM